MPRIIEERWTGIGWAIQDEHLPITGADGQPVHDHNGLPKTEHHTTLVLIVPLPDGQHVVRVPFSQDKKRELVAALTGGIIIANGHPS